MSARRSPLLLALVLAVAVLVTWRAYSQVSSLHVGQITQVSSVRFDRTQWDYTYRIRIVNAGGAQRAVAAYVTSTSPSTRIMDNEVLVGDVAAGATVTSTDTFTIRQDRTLPFNPATLSWSLISEPANTLPVAHAGPDQTLRVGDRATLDGSASTDADGQALTYHWTFVSRPASSSAVLDNANAVMPAFTLDRLGVYVLELVVSDGDASSAADRVQISTINSSPIANAGPDRTVARGTQVTLDGSASSDPDGDLLNFDWQLIQRPTGSTTVLAGAQTAIPTLTVDLPGDYIVRLLVNDATSTGAPDEVRISTENSIPVAQAGPNRSGFVGDVFALDGAGSTDGDDDPLSYFWTFVSRPVASTATLSDAGTPGPSFIADVVGLYVAQLIVNDGFADSIPDTATVTVDVRPPPADRDGDGLTDAREAQLGTDPDDPDSDDDGLTDGREADSTNTNPLDADSDDDTLADGAEVGTHGTNPNSVDTDGDSFRDDEEIRAGSDPVSTGSTPAGTLPPNPETVATVVDLKVPTTTFASTRFLYTGVNPIQTGVAVGAIDAKRAAVVRGRVLDRSNNPLPGVAITVRNQSQLGQTLSRTDGRFDLAVNGGGTLVIHYQRNGYLPAQRQIEASWQGYTTVEDAVLVQQDTNVTTIDLTNTTQAFQVARGSVVTDGDGTRQATLLIPQGTQARIYQANGTTTPVTTLNLRLTEYTVGANGPQAMPAPLPPASAYTYAFEMRADEATLKVAGKDVLFDRPVPFYINNFLEFPVGTAVPVGYYDQDRSTWIPSENGRVIRILSISGGSATIDGNGDGQADNSAALAVLGVTDAERVQLATLYSAGQTLWRVMVTHLSTWDCNWPYKMPDDAVAPQNLPPRNELGTKLDDATDCTSSIVECENQILRESIGVAGTSLALHYASDRVPGRQSSRMLSIAVSGATLPPSLTRIDLTIEVAGRLFEQTLPPTINQRVNFLWDGRDVYGRPLAGVQPVSIRIGYAYDPVYATPAELSAAFARFSGVPLEGSRARNEVRIWQEMTANVGTTEIARPAVAGWSLSPHHAYDPLSRILYLGDGTRRSANAEASAVVTTVAGAGPLSGTGDGGPATRTQLETPFDVVVRPDGGFYIAETAENRVRFVSAAGIIATVAGNGAFGGSGDGGPATAASLEFPQVLALGADGSLYIAGVNTIRRVDPAGIISTVAGNGTRSGPTTDGLPATQVALAPLHFTVDAESNVYIGDGLTQRIRKVSTDGLITTIAGGGTGGVGGPASGMQLLGAIDMAVGPDGSLYVAEQSGDRVRRIAPDGIVYAVAGSGLSGSTGDGGAATAAALESPTSLAFGVDGSLYINSAGTRIRRVSPNGIITTVAGIGSTQGATTAEGAPAMQTLLFAIQGIGAAPDGSIYYVDFASERIRKISPAYAGFGSGELALASSDGTLLHRFDPSGRHLSTIGTLTGATLLSFQYDAAGNLVELRDADGLVTTIERDTSGRARALVAPFGQRTVLALDPGGYLSSATNPAGEAYEMTYSADGLLRSFEDPRGHASTFTYDAAGQLSRDQNAEAGSLSLVRADLTDGHSVAVTNALGRVSTHSVRNLSNSDRERRHIQPDGTISTSVITTAGVTTTSAADGSVTEVREGPDPRFTMQAPIPTSTRLTTGGRTLVTTATRTVNLATVNDPLSLTTLTDTSVLNGRTTTSVFNRASRTFTDTSAANRVTTHLIDNLGRTLQRSATGLQSLNRSYDAQGRLQTLRQGAGAEERAFTFAYNAQGQLDTATDSIGRETHYGYDLAGRLTSLTLPNGRALGFGYDPAGNLTSVTPPGREPHRLAYDDIGQTVEYVPPSVAGGGTQHTSYEYSLDQALTRVTRPDGLEIGMEYDTAGRLSRMTTPEGVTTYGYDTATGKPTTVTAPGSEGLAFSYAGALLRQTSWSGSLAGNVGYDYDNDLRLSSVSVNGANPFVYAYDGESLVTSVSNQTLGVTFTLAPSPQNGLLTGTTLGSSTDTYTYNGFAEVTDYVARQGSTPVFRNELVRDKLGRITRRTETLGGVGTVYDYGYETSGRLTEVRRDGTLVESYGYDDNGNRTHVNGVQVAHYDAQDRLLDANGATYTHTPNGELASSTVAGATTTYAYDSLGVLREVVLPGGARVTYVVDGQSRRIGRKRDGVLQQGFLYQDQLRPAAELDGSGSLIARFVYGTGPGAPDLMLKGGATYRLIKDHLGSPRLVVNVANGTVAQRIDYDAWGKVVADTNPGFQPFGFAGGLYDRDTQLVRFGARDYSPETGRWTSRDASFTIGNDVNLYSYAWNNPVLYVDLMGRKPTRREVLLGIKHYTLGGLDFMEGHLALRVAKLDRRIAIGIWRAPLGFPQKALGSLAALAAYAANKQYGEEALARADAHFSNANSYFTGQETLDALREQLDAKISAGAQRQRLQAEQREHVSPGESFMSPVDPDCYPRPVDSPVQPMSVR